MLVFKHVTKTQKKYNKADILLLFLYFRLSTLKYPKEAKLL